MACDVNLLALPDNGKAWNNYTNANKWELECELNYEIERGLLFRTLCHRVCYAIDTFYLLNYSPFIKVSKRDFHRCKRSDNTWASPENVVVKCRFSSEGLQFILLFEILKE